jgi:DNA-binding transcriptional regulator YiaG
MSQFDKYTTTEFVESLRVFLCIKKKGFLRDYGFVDSETTPKRGRLPRYKAEAVDALIIHANEKSEWAESICTSIGERIRIARDYLSLSDASLGRNLHVSRELVRLWRADVHKPTDMSKVANALNVPLNWLETGQQDGLPANSHIGVRIGGEALKYREQLYAMTLKEIESLAEGADLASVQVQLEKAVHSNPQMAKLARRTGGRWQHDGKTLVFAPWVPIREHGLSRRYWSDKVESIIEAELSKVKSVYAAWGAIQKRCADLGMTPAMYPTKISLYKRLEKVRSYQNTFGTDLNMQVKRSMSQQLQPQ